MLVARASWMFTVSLMNEMKPPWWPRSVSPPCQTAALPRPSPLVIAMRVSYGLRKITEYVRSWALEPATSWAGTVHVWPSPLPNAATTFASEASPLSDADAAPERTASDVDRTAIATAAAQARL